MAITPRYEDVPNGYIHCFHHQCAQKDKCMHYLVGTIMKPIHPLIYTINIPCVPENTIKCKHFLQVQQTRIAWGIKNLFDTLPTATSRRIKAVLLAKYKRSQYYRFYRKERGLTPEVQQFIKDLFKKHHVKEEPQYEFYTTEYVWYERGAAYTKASR